MSAHPPDTEAAANLLDAAWQSVYFSDRQRTQQLLAQVSDAGQRLGDPNLAMSARLLGRLVTLRSSTREASAATFQALLAEAETLLLPRMRWLAIDGIMCTALLAGDPVSALQAGAATAEVPMAERSLNEFIYAEFMRGVAYCWAGQAGEGLQCGHRALYAARQHGQAAQLAFVLSFLADVHLNRFGNADDALPLALEAVQLMDTLPLDKKQLNNAVVCIDALQALGHHDQARNMLQAARVAHGHSIIWVSRSPRLACQYVRAGLLDEADACLDHFAADKPYDPFQAWEWRLAKVLLHVALGEHAEALAVAREELARPIAVVRPARQLLTMHDAIRQCCDVLGDAEGAAAALRQAQQLLVPVLRDAAYARYLSMDLSTEPLLPPAQRPADRRRLQAIDRRARQPEAAERGPRVPRFVAHVTHELATPVSGFVWLSEALLRTPLNEQQRMHVEAMHQGAADMQQLVNDVLDLARLERGLFRLHPRPVQLLPTLEQCFLPFARLGEERGLQMSLELVPDLPVTVLVDGVRLRQVLNNLLSNALKFTACGCVRLSVSWKPQEAPALPLPAAGELDLVVQDTGRGIASEVMQRLFVEFEQGDEAIAPQHGGNGLGLALCRQLLQLMGGQITAHSQPGQGARFNVRLPVALAVQPAQFGDEDPLPTTPAGPTART